MPNYPKVKSPQPSKPTGPLALVANTVKRIIDSQNKMVSDLIKQVPGMKPNSVPRPPSPRDSIGTKLRWGGKPKCYYVQKEGETLVTVANKFNLSVSSIVALNEKMGTFVSADILRPNTLLSKGDMLYLPIFE